MGPIFQDEKILAVAHAFRRDDELGEIRRRELLIEGQEEARRACAHEVDVMIDLTAPIEVVLEALCLAQRRIE